MTGEATVYFHGMPGGAGELALFGPLQTPPFVADRLFVRDDDAGRYFDRLASGLLARFPRSRFRLIGFSLGAVAALHVAHRLGDRASSIDLVSAAAPLSTGDYLPRMAGQPVFKLALNSRFAFRALTKLQSLAMGVAPGIVYNALFATAQGGDIALREDPAFKTALCRIIRESLASPAFTREIENFVTDWSALLAGVTQPVRLWHGTLDNWPPPDMAAALAAALPRSELVWIDGTSHYSTLKAFFERTGL